MLTKEGKAKVESQFSLYGYMSRLTGRKIVPSYFPPKIACVYAFEMSDSTVKIGLAKEVESRKKGVRSAIYLDVLRTYNTDFAPRTFMYTIERKCHEKFEPFRVRGEYFAIPFEDACAELDRHREEIATALKTADENFIDELKYFEELKEQYLNSFKVAPVVKPVPVVALPEEPTDIYRVYVFLLSDGNVAIGLNKRFRTCIGEVKRKTGLKVVDIYFTPEMSYKNVRIVESCLKAIYSEQCVKGEIFSVAFDEMCATVKYYTEMAAAKLSSESVNLIADK